MDFALEKKRVQVLLFIVGIIVLGITAEKCRQMVGEEGSSKSGRFTLLNCFDMGTGTLACSVKEVVKLYANNIRASHVELARNIAIEAAIADSISQGLAAKEAAKQAQIEGKKAAKLASRQAKRITGPIVSSGWDFFEAMYYGGTMIEGFLRGCGTLVGTYTIGFHGEQRLGRFGYLVGSHLGSWVGGRIGLMVYDVFNGFQFLLLAHSVEAVSSESLKPTEESYAYDQSEEPKTSEDSYAYDQLEEPKTSEDSYDYDQSQELKVSEDSYADDKSQESESFEDSFSYDQSEHHTGFLETEYAVLVAGLDCVAATTRF
ncbi:hypothetical protein V2J09_019663 [Rumex salicifolius]